MTLLLTATALLGLALLVLVCRCPRCEGVGCRPAPVGWVVVEPLSEGLVLVCDEGDEEALVAIWRDVLAGTAGVGPGADGARGN